MTRRVRFLMVGLLLVLLVFAGWSSLRAASAATTSYSVRIPHQESLLVDMYEVVDGVAFFKRTADRLVADKLAHRERIEVLMLWAHENVRPQFASPGRVVADNFLDIVRRGHGYCDQTAHVFATLAYFAGYDVRLLFLRDPAGVSPHTVAEVLVNGRWVLVDAWLGVLFAGGNGELLGIGDLGRNTGQMSGYSVLGMKIDPSYFQRGTVFRTFPYQDLGGFAEKVAGKLLRLPVVTVPDDSARRPPADPAARGDTALDLVPAPSREVILEMDSARRAHLEGRYAQAAALYRGLLTEQVPIDMADSVRFFLGLALLREGEHSQAVESFDSALSSNGRTAWSKSVLFYRAEAKEALGDIVGAIADLRSADIPPAHVRLAALDSR